MKNCEKITVKQLEKKCLIIMKKFQNLDNFSSNLLRIAKIIFFQIF